MAERIRLDPDVAVTRQAPASGRRTSLQLVPVSNVAANAFVAGHHRHAGRVQGAKLAIGATSGSQLVEVAILGRAVARRLDDAGALEVRRCAPPHPYRLLVSPGSGLAGRLPGGAS